MMGQGPSGGLNRQPEDRRPDGGNKNEKKFVPACVGIKKRKQKGLKAAARRPTVTPPLSKCKRRLLKSERIKDYLLIEEEFVANQERLKLQEEEKTDEDHSMVDYFRGSPMIVGNLEELIDEKHAIVSSSVGPEYYAMANSTSPTFLHVVGSELIQKYLGEVPKLVRVADELSPSIVFLDEIDAVGTKGYDTNSGGKCEIQRAMLELLDQLDGYGARGDVCRYLEAIR